MRNSSWIRVGLNAWSLGVEASSVIARRMFKLGAGGPAAQKEARRMIDEKISAGIALQKLAMTGQLGRTAHSVATKTLAHYRRKVRANKRRLRGG